MATLKEMSGKGLVEQFGRVHQQATNRRFAFVLGAGASRTSGIKAAGTLVDEWLGILHKRDPEHHHKEFADWLDQHSKNHIPDFDPRNSAEFYPQAYSALFAHDPDDGFAYLEATMERAEPRYGYAVLAFILAKTSHRVVITTNFDNLIADALANFESTYPIVCGHDALAGFAKPDLRRPLIVKVHHDLFFAPKSQKNELQILGEGYAAALKRLLSRYTPIVIGYGGNDGSLMTAFEKLEPNELTHGVYWCYREGDEKPKKRIQDFVALHKGWLVAIPGFDELMTLFGEQVGYELPDERIRKQAEKRANDLIQHRQALREDLQRAAKKSENVQSAAVAALAALQIEIKPETQLRWWQIEERVQGEPDIAKRDAIYVQGIAALPESAPLLGNYGLFLEIERKDHDRAEEMFERALSLEPENVNNLSNYGLFLMQTRKNHARAREIFERVLKIDPKHANTLGNYALLLHRVGKDYDHAQELFERAVLAEPEHPNNLCNFGSFYGKFAKIMNARRRYTNKPYDSTPNIQILY